MSSRDGGIFTLPAALDAAVLPNDTIHISAGTYTGEFEIRGARGVSIIGVPGVTIKASSAALSALSVHRSTVRIEGVHFDGNQDRSPSGDKHTLNIVSGSVNLVNCTFTGTVSKAICMAGEAATLRCERCTFAGDVSEQLGTYILSGSDGNRVDLIDCRFEDIGGFSDGHHNQAIYFARGTLRVRSCTFVNCSQGIDLRAAAIDCSISDCEFEGGEYGGLSTGGTSSAIRDAGLRTTVDRCNAYDYQSYSILIAQGTGCRYADCTFAHAIDTAEARVLRVRCKSSTWERCAFIGSGANDSVCVFCDVEFAPEDNRLNECRFERAQYLYALTGLPSLRPAAYHYAANDVNGVVVASPTHIPVGMGLPLIPNDDYIRWVT